MNDVTCATILLIQKKIKNCDKIQKVERVVGEIEKKKLKKIQKFCQIVKKFRFKRFQ
jgi:hypothetical protein